MANQLVSDDVMAARRALCADCPSKKDMSGNPAFVFMNTLGVETPEIAKSICGECMCPTQFRTRKAHHACPLGKWGAKA